MTLSPQSAPSSAGAPPVFAPPVSAPSRMTGQDDEVDLLPPSRRRDDKTAETAPRKRILKAITGLTIHRSLKTPLLAGVALLGALVIGQMSGGDSSHDNWIHHQQAARHAGKDGFGIKWVSPSGPAQFVNGIPLDSPDLDQNTSQAFLAARTRDQAELIMQDAQPQLIDPGFVGELPVEPAVPSLSNGLAAEVMTGDTRFFHIFLFDSCYEDGDVVDVKINGLRFATARLTNAGVTLSVPMNEATSVSVAGVYDGGGGITVACRTSRGEGFIRVLAEGEEQVLATVGQ